MRSNAEECKGLLTKAEHDWQAAGIGLAHGAPLDTVCFHLHQAAEKLPKEALAFQGVSYPLTHDLEELLKLAIAEFPALAEFEGSLAEFYPDAVLMRCDDLIHPDEAEVISATDTKRKLRAWVHGLLPAAVLP